MDEEGRLAHRADEFIAAAGEIYHRPEAFAPECAHAMVEVNTRPVAGVGDLRDEYHGALETAVAAAGSLGLRLYPLATYPLPARPVMRREPRYELQARTLGRRRFELAGKCVGAHVHVEAPPGTIDPRVGISYFSTGADREDLIHLYNVATALDPALVALTRSSPFYEGHLTGMAVRAASYRGSPEYAPYGLYAHMPEVGGLRPYAPGPEDLVEQQFHRHHTWREAVRRAGIRQHHPGSGLLRSSWNPVRLNAHNTVEVRSMDGNLPSTIMIITELITAATDRVRNEGLRVLPGEEPALRVEGNILLVPPFQMLCGHLARAAIHGPADDPGLVRYMDSVLRFAGIPDPPPTTESVLRRRFPTRHLSEEEGLELVKWACAGLEEYIAAQRHGSPA